MLTGDYEKDKAELERLIAHEEHVLDTAHWSRLHYTRLLNELKAEEGVRRVFTIVSRSSSR